jgi:hypothetical protein
MEDLTHKKVLHLVLSVPACGKQPIFIIEMTFPFWMSQFYPFATSLYLFKTLVYVVCPEIVQ